MKILFVLENTIEDLHGGTEVSSNHLANLLKKPSHQVKEWTPYQRRKPIFWYTSIIGQFYISLSLIKKLFQDRPQIIHVQGKYLIPPVVVLGKIFNIPSVITIRDYIVVCPIGLCLFEKPRQHNFKYFLRQEIPNFLGKYHSRESIFIRILRILLLIRGWFVTRSLRWWLKQADQVIAVSKAVQQVLKIINIESIVIYNSFDPTWLKQLKPRKKSQTILFIGKGSYGKGYDLFQTISHRKEFRKFNFKSIGIQQKLSYQKTLQQIKNALVVVIPSRWQEPFGRVALESIIIGTPAVATNKGGLPEIIENNVSGIIAHPDIASLTNALSKTIKQNQQLRSNLQDRKKAILNKFSQNPTQQHLKLYKQLIK